MPERDTTVLERLAVARLTHHVNELQIKVENDVKLVPPRRKIFHCVTDETALTASIPELKRWVADGGMTMTVPLSALDALDKLKKGTDDANIHARESIRYLDRVQNPRSKPIRGVMIQSPSERFPTWADAAATARPPAMPTDEPQTPVETPAALQPLLNCALFLAQARAQKQAKATHPADEEVVVVTNDAEVATWAAALGLVTVPSAALGALLQREEIEFAERKRHYDYAVANPPSASPSAQSPVRRARGGGRAERGGHSPAGSGGGRRDRAGSKEDLNGFGRGLRGAVEAPDYVVRGAPGRGVARGKGRLWEP